MMKKSKPKNILLDLGRRERQIVETVLRLGEASVSQVLAEIPDPPTYTSVRTMLQLLVKKDVLQFHSDGKRYLYRVRANQGTVRTAAVKSLLATFFPDNASVAIATILELVGDQLEPEEINNIKRKIDEARKENR
ncbi:MAG: BlaI/MecI/CopY family transcriptional regulator [Planctomycetaceae bacterium]|jgi:predicted transcriptional regulator|nr:BlaI/MecI/CopY family transcriptional regulator [Planctomycetaceae bacterium]